MKYLYPASHDIPSLDPGALALKIARHARCTLCPSDSCTGLHPPAGVKVKADTDPLKSLLGLGEYGSDDDDDEEEEEMQRLDSCRCGHGVEEHGADAGMLGRDEFMRRARVAVRLDELLEDAGRLLDFTFLNDDILSLRRQMEIPTKSPTPLGARSPTLSTSSIDKEILSEVSSALTDLSPTTRNPAAKNPPTKKRRISWSSESSDDEDKPLAALARSAHAGKKQRSGKGMKKAKAATAPVSLVPPTAEEQAAMTRHEPEQKIKVEDAMDGGQLDRLATGVTVDTEGASSSSQPPIKPEKMAHIELRKGIIQVVAVENDAQPRSLVILTGLKTLFQKQLPKMPREYIARLVYDENSKCLAIIKRGYKVVGGICYRPFPHRGFAEIVFFATHSVDQVKGYGGMLMDHFKTHIKATYPNMLHFLTYADNYAVGYFKKQGFSKEITLDRSVWAGYIKDYEGGTIMQCTMLKRVDYLSIRDVLTRQREAVLDKIREKSRSHLIYPGLPQFMPGKFVQGVPVRPEDVPGLRESGWTPSMAAYVKPPAKNAEAAGMRRLLMEMQNHSAGWPFLKPVNLEEVADYCDVIKEPMDFHTMEHKLDNNQYPNMDAFVADAQLVFDNCKTYNPEETVYVKNARKMEKFVKQWLTDRVKKEGA